MSLGALFSITQAEFEKLKAFEDDEERLEYLHGEIEELYFKEQRQRVCETDKAWDAIHRCLTDGKLEYENGEYPLSHAILGGDLLNVEDDYTISAKTPSQVADIAKALLELDPEVLKTQYFQLDDDYDQPLSQEDWEYTLDNFLDIRQFYQLASTEGRTVIFTAD